MPTRLPSVSLTGREWKLPSASRRAASRTGVWRLFLPDPASGIPDTSATPLFDLYNPAIAAERNGNRMQDVLPLEDFYVAVADSQKLDMSGPVPAPLKARMRNS